MSDHESHSEAESVSNNGRQDGSLNLNDLESSSEEEITIARNRSSRRSLTMEPRNEDQFQAPIDSLSNTGMQADSPLKVDILHPDGTTVTVICKFIEKVMNCYDAQSSKTRLVGSYLLDDSDLVMPPSRKSQAFALKNKSNGIVTEFWCSTNAVKLNMLKIVAKAKEEKGVLQMRRISVGGGSMKVMNTPTPIIEPSSRNTASRDISMRNSRGDNVPTFNNNVQPIPMSFETPVHNIDSGVSSNTPSSSSSFYRRNNHGNGTYNPNSENNSAAGRQYPPQIDPEDMYTASTITENSISSPYIPNRNQVNTTVNNPSISIAKALSPYHNTSGTFKVLNRKVIGQTLDRSVGSNSNSKSAGGVNFEREQAKNSSSLDWIPPYYGSGKVTSTKLVANSPAAAMQSQQFTLNPPPPPPSTENDGRRAHVKEKTYTGNTKTRIPSRSKKAGGNNSGGLGSSSVHSNNSNNTNSSTATTVSTGRGTDTGGSRGGQGMPGKSSNHANPSRHNKHQEVQNQYSYQEDNSGKKHRHNNNAYDSDEGMTDGHGQHRQTHNHSQSHSRHQESTKKKHDHGARSNHSNVNNYDSASDINNSPSMDVHTDPGSKSSSRHTGGNRNTGNSNNVRDKHGRREMPNEEDFRRDNYSSNEVDLSYDSYEHQQHGQHHGHHQSQSGDMDEFMSPIENIHREQRRVTSFRDQSQSGSDDLEYRQQQSYDNANHSKNRSSNKHKPINSPQSSPDYERNRAVPQSKNNRSSSASSLNHASSSSSLKYASGSASPYSSRLEGPGGEYRSASSSSRREEQLKSMRYRDQEWSPKDPIPHFGRTKSPSHHTGSSPEKTPTGSGSSPRSSSRGRSQSPARGSGGLLYPPKWSELAGYEAISSHESFAALFEKRRGRSMSPGLFGRTQGSAGSVGTESDAGGGGSSTGWGDSRHNSKFIDDIVKEELSRFEANVSRRIALQAAATAVTAPSTGDANNSKRQKSPNKVSGKWNDLRHSSPSIQSKKMTQAAEWQRMQDWLKSIGMERYCNAFLSAGICKLSVVELMRSRDLGKMGVSSRHISYILESIHDLSNQTKALSEEALNEGIKFEYGKKPDKKVEYRENLMTKLSHKVDDSINKVLHDIPSPVSEPVAVNVNSVATKKKRIESSRKYVLNKQDAREPDQMALDTSLSCPDSDNSDSGIVRPINSSHSFAHFKGSGALPMDEITIPIDTHVLLSPSKLSNVDNRPIFTNSEHALNSSNSKKKKQMEEQTQSTIAAAAAAACEKIITALDCGDVGMFQQFWPVVVNHLPSDAKTPQFSSSFHAKMAMEFHLYLFFAAYPISHNQDSLVKENGIKVLKAYLDEVFDLSRNYHDEQGHTGVDFPLLKSPEFAVLASFAWVPNPQNNPAFEPLFKPNWGMGLRKRLLLFLQVMNLVPTGPMGMAVSSPAKAERTADEERWKGHPSPAASDMRIHRSFPQFSSLPESYTPRKPVNPSHVEVSCLHESTELEELNDSSQKEQKPQQQQVAPVFVKPKRVIPFASKAVTIGVVKEKLKLSPSHNNSNNVLQSPFGAGMKGGLTKPLRTASADILDSNTNTNTISAASLSEGREQIHEPSSGVTSAPTAVPRNHSSNFESLTIDAMNMIDGSNDIDNVDDDDISDLSSIDSSAQLPEVISLQNQLDLLQFPSVGNNTNRSPKTAPVAKNIIPNNHIIANNPNSNSTHHSKASSLTLTVSPDKTSKLMGPYHISNDKANNNSASPRPRTSSIKSQIDGYKKNIHNHMQSKLLLAPKDDSTDDNIGALEMSYLPEESVKMNAAGNGPSTSFAVFLADINVDEYQCQESVEIEEVLTTPLNDHTVHNDEVLTENDISIPEVVSSAHNIVEDHFEISCFDINEIENPFTNSDPSNNFADVNVIIEKENVEDIPRAVTNTNSNVLLDDVVHNMVESLDTEIVLPISSRENNDEITKIYIYANIEDGNHNLDGDNDGLDPNEIENPFEDAIPPPPSFPYPQSLETNIPLLDAHLTLPIVSEGTDNLEQVPADQTAVGSTATTKDSSANAILNSAASVDQKTVADITKVEDLSANITLDSADTDDQKTVENIATMEDSSAKFISNSAAPDDLKTVKDITKVDDLSAKAILNSTASIDQKTVEDITTMEDSSVSVNSNSAASDVLKTVADIAKVEDLSANITFDLALYDDLKTVENLTTTEDSSAKVNSDSAASVSQTLGDGTKTEDSSNEAFSSDLPKNWKERFDKNSNRPYYFNKITKIRQWKRPTSDDIVSDNNSSFTTTNGTEISPLVDLTTSS